MGINLDNAWSSQFFLPCLLTDLKEDTITNEENKHQKRPHPSNNHLHAQPSSKHPPPMDILTLSTTSLTSADVDHRKKGFLHPTRGGVAQA